MQRLKTHWVAEFHSVNINALKISPWKLFTSVCFCIESFFNTKLILFSDTKPAFRPNLPNYKHQGPIR